MDTTHTEVTLEEAKANLESLVERAANGERITIACAGKAKVDLTLHPRPKIRDQAAIDRAVAELRTFSKGRKLDGLSIREMIDEGRKY